MSTSYVDSDYGHCGFADVLLIVEDLLCQIEVLLATNGDPAAIANLWAQIDLLRGR